MSLFSRTVMAVTGAALLGACTSGAGSARLDERSSAVVVAQALPPPDQQDMVKNFTNYRIGPGDKIKVAVFGAEELEREGIVDAAGNFSMPLAGSVLAGGKSPDEVEQAITDKLAGRYVKNPQVTVTVLEAVSQTFTVDGSVRQPGVYPITGKMTLQQAVATAKGADEFANVNNVVIFRTVNNRKMAALFSLKDIRSGRLGDPDIYNNDIVVVGENATKRFFKDVTGAFPLLGAFVPVF